MIYGDDGQTRSIALDADSHSRLVKGGVDVIDWDGVVWVGCVAAHIADDA